MKDSNQTILEDLNTAEFPLNENTELNLEKIKAKTPIGYSSSTVTFTLNSCIEPLYVARNYLDSG